MTMNGSAHSQLLAAYVTRLGERWCVMPLHELIAAAIGVWRDEKLRELLTNEAASLVLRPAGTTDERATNAENACARTSVSAYRESRAMMS